MILQRPRISVGDSGFEPGISAPYKFYFTPQFVIEDIQVTRKNVLWWLLTWLFYDNYYVVTNLVINIIDNVNTNLITL